MKRNKKLKISGLFLLFLLVVGVIVAYFKFNPKRALNLILPEISKISLVKAVIENDTAHVEIYTVIQNKSFYQLEIDSIDYQLKVKDLALPKEKVNLQLRQKRFQIDTVALPIDLPIKTIRNTVKTSQDEDSIQLTGDFHIFYNTFFGSYLLSFHKELKLCRPVPPEINVLKVEHRKVKIFDGTVTANVVIQIKNRGKNLDLKTNSIKYKFKVDNLVDSDGTYNQTILIKPKSETTVTIPITMKIGKLLHAGWLVLRDKDDVNYTVTVEAELEQGKLNHKIPVEVTASGKTEIVKE